MQTLNLFYEQPPKHDLRFPYDRYLQRLRRIIKRGTAPAGQMRIFLNLQKGLDRIGIPYRVNDYDYIQQHPEELACILGKDNVLNKMPWTNPILYGPNVYDHPSDDPDLLNRIPIRKIIVSCDWFRRMCEPAWGPKLAIWRAGIDTDLWSPGRMESKPIDILFYDKVMWNYEQRKQELVVPIRRELARRGLKTAVLRYGSYRETHYRALLKKCRAMIYLSEHETQGLARLQANSCNVPVLAWDQEGFWEDPSYFPHKVRFAPVTSVPDWDKRCGVKFKNIAEFPARLTEFLTLLSQGDFDPREYAIANFTLEKSAHDYLRIVHDVQASLAG
jgi:hypothetical protein